MSGAPPPSGPSTGKAGMENLDKLIADSEQSLARLEGLQKRANAGIGQRFSSHMKRNSGHMINVILAGSVFVVALSRLNEKYAHQTDLEELEGKVKGLRAQTEGMAQRLAAAERFATEVEEAAEAGGRQLSSRLKAALESFRAGGSGDGPGGAAAAAAASSSASHPMI